MCGGGELVQGGADLAQPDQGSAGGHAIDGGQVGAELGQEQPPQGFVGAAGGGLRRRLRRSGWGCRRRRLRGDRCEFLDEQLDLCVALGGELAVVAPGLEGLAQHEKVFGLPVPSQGCGDLGLGLLAATVAQSGQRGRVAFARHDGVEDGLPGLAGDVADGAVQQHVHLVEGLLQAQDMFAARAHEVVALAHQRADRADGGRRAEGGLEQADAVQVLQPLAVLHVGLAGGHVLDVAGVGQDHLEPPRLQNLEERNPVHPGGFHGHGPDAAGHQPVGQQVQGGGVGGEAAHRLRVALGRHRHEVDGGAQVDTGSIGTLDGTYPHGGSFDALGAEGLDGAHGWDDPHRGGPTGK